MFSLSWRWPHFSTPQDRTETLCPKSSVLLRALCALRNSSAQNCARRRERGGPRERATRGIFDSTLVTPFRLSASRCQSTIHDLLRLFDESGEVGLVFETLGVDLVDIFGAGRPGREPAIGRNDLQPADGRVVSRGSRQLGEDRLAGQLGLPDSLGGSSFSSSAFCSRSGRGVDPCVERRAERFCEFLVMLAGILARAGRDLRRQRSMIGPSLSVVHTVPSRRKKAGPGAFFSAKTVRAVEQPRCEPFEPHRHFRRAGVRPVAQRGRSCCC